MKYDFGGYATRNNLRCSDGRTIRPGAFNDCDGAVVPLVWNHRHESGDNVLGHALLENRSDGVYAYCLCNDTEQGANAKELVRHGDIEALSIYANDLKQVPTKSGKDVVHGVIREVSLVLAGANPGAMIDSISFEHSDGSAYEPEAIIYTGEYINPEDGDYVKHDSENESETEAEATAEVEEPETSENDDQEETEEIAHANESEETEMADTNEPTVMDVYESMSDEQKDVVAYFVGLALEEAEGGDDVEHSDIEDGGNDNMKHNVFEGSNENGTDVLSHSQKMEVFDSVMSDARAYGSFHDSMMAHAAEYGIDNVDILFPDAKDIRNTPDFIKREMAWVSAVMGGTRHTPFSRIRSKVVDITADEARARGYVKGNQKVNEVITAAKRETTPQTIYKKQKLDRDDVLDITDFDVIAWLWSEMRIMLDEEIARAILIGDGRAADDPDKIKETNVRPIVGDSDLYSLKVDVSDSAHSDYRVLIEEISKSNKDYRGSGNPVFFCSPEVHSEMLWTKDQMGRKLYDSDAELCSALRVSKIIEVPLMADFVYKYNSVDHFIKGIKVNLIDYTIGTDRGGQISQFEDFDIDYNQQKYLLETRMSGAMTLPQAAQIYRKVVTYTEVTDVETGDPIPANSYYERSGAGTAADPYVYALTEDTTVQSGTTYYTRS